MKPFAYQLMYWSWGELESTVTLPSLRDIVSRVITSTVVNNPCISALYPDGTSIRLDERMLRAKVQLNRKELRAEAKVLIEKDTKAKAAFFSTFPGGSTCTGSPWLCDEGEDAVVEALVRDREWRWKTLEEIDWTAFESSKVEA